MLLGRNKIIVDVTAESEDLAIYTKVGEVLKLDFSFVVVVDASLIIQIIGQPWLAKLRFNSFYWYATGLLSLQMNSVSTISRNIYSHGRRVFWHNLDSSHGSSVSSRLVEERSVESLSENGFSAIASLARTEAITGELLSLFFFRGKRTRVGSSETLLNEAH